MLTKIMTYLQSSRGGEVKFMTYDKMYFDQFFNCIVAKLFQIKTLTTVPTSFCDDYEHPEISFYYILGAHWMCEDGLL